MKHNGSRLFVFVVSLFAAGLTFKVMTYNVKADTAFKTQPGVVIRSASLTTDKTIVIPEKSKTEKQDVSKKSQQKLTLSRGGSGLKKLSVTSSSGNTGVVSFASQFLGRPYVWGAAGPKAFDCSGFTSYVYSAFGVYLDHYTGSQFGSGNAVSRDNLAPGDLVFFNTYGSISHVGIYIGNGSFIHAANERTGVTISSLSDGYYSGRYAGARRVK